MGRDASRGIRTYYRPSMNAFEAAAKAGRKTSSLMSWTPSSNQNKCDRADATSIPATFLHVTVAR